MSLVLASASASRAGLLRAAGVEFSVHPADLDEAALTASVAGASPAYVALALARAKAQAVSEIRTGAPVLGCDSVIGFEADCLSKCPDMAAARALLARLRGREHSLISAAVLTRDGQIVWEHVSPCRMAMRDFSDVWAYSCAREGSAAPNCSAITRRTRPQQSMPLRSRPWSRKGRPM